MTGASSRVVDEFSAVVGARDLAIHLTERGRSANAATVLAVQSARGLGDDDQADRLIGATGMVALFGIAEPERILNLAGTISRPAVSAVAGRDGACPTPTPKPSAPGSTPTTSAPWNPGTRTSSPVAAASASR